MLCMQSYGQLLNRADLCTPGRGMQILLNLARLEDWSLQRKFSRSAHFFAKTQAEVRSGVRLT